MSKAELPKRSLFRREAQPSPELGRALDAIMGLSTTSPPPLSTTETPRGRSARQTVQAPERSSPPVEPVTAAPVVKPAGPQARSADRHATKRTEYMREQKRARRARP